MESEIESMLPVLESVKLSQVGGHLPQLLSLLLTQLLLLWSVMLCVTRSNTSHLSSLASEKLWYMSRLV